MLLGSSSSLRQAGAGKLLSWGQVTRLLFNDVSIFQRVHFSSGVQQYKESKSNLSLGPAGPEISIKLPLPLITLTTDWYINVKCILMCEIQVLFIVLLANWIWYLHIFLQNIYFSFWKLVGNFLQKLRSVLQVWDDQQLSCYY